MTISSHLFLALFILLSSLSCGSRGGSAADSKEVSTGYFLDSVVRPVKSVIATSEEVVVRDFVGLSTPIRSVNLAFKISGQILSLPVSKGDYVSRGQLLCRIDPRDVELQLAADRSAFDQASSRYSRAKRLLEHDAVSLQEFEGAESSYIQARSLYDNSREMLAETSLESPFAALVEIVYVDTYQRVQAGESVIRIVSPVTDRVEFTLPEGLLSVMRDSTTRFVVSFDNIDGIEFSAAVVEYARTSSDASGFPVTLRIDNPDPSRHILRSGISCTITMVCAASGGDAVVVPLTALYTPIGGGVSVWVVGSDERVSLRAVRLGDPVGQSSVAIVEGVSGGERIVTAGVYQLQDGQRVGQL